MIYTNHMIMGIYERCSKPLLVGYRRDHATSYGYKHCGSQSPGRCCCAIVSMCNTETGQTGQTGNGGDGMIVNHHYDSIIPGHSLLSTCIFGRFQKWTMADNGIYVYIYMYVYILYIYIYIVYIYILYIYIYISTRSTTCRKLWLLTIYNVQDHCPFLSG